MSLRLADRFRRVRHWSLRLAGLVCAKLRRLVIRTVLLGHRAARFELGAPRSRIVHARLGLISPSQLLATLEGERYQPVERQLQPARDLVPTTVRAARL